MKLLGYYENEEHKVREVLIEKNNEKKVLTLPYNNEVRKLFSFAGCSFEESVLYTNTDKWKTFLNENI